MPKMRRLMVPISAGSPRDRQGMAEATTHTAGSAWRESGTM